ncbi:hypothetical protein J437_LFUL003410 [Ladona fulva]|uniref:Major facilitator superfamily (MFS) profile domain-containing protein n=1 Tax=Ladona fulva TaxID=123851 RepID=A0A8K0K431_LADFU|nr:hypothetical protein J437_LFUL003410 [Ladona fulva]
MLDNAVDLFMPMRKDTMDYCAELLRTGMSKATIASLAAGTAIGWSSPMMDRLMGITGSYEPLERPLTEDESSWVSSLMALGALPGTLIGGLLIDKIGRRNSFILLGGIPAIIGWITMLLAHNPGTLYAGRFLIGVSAGAANTLAPVYIAEVSSASERGALCSMPQLMNTFGVMVQYTVGPYVSYHVLAGIDLIFPIVFVIGFFLIPESPYYLLAKSKRKDAEKSLVWFRGGGRMKNDEPPAVDVSHELNRMAQAIDESGIKDSSLLDSFKDVFASKGNRRAFLVTAGLLFAQQFSGIMVVLFNAETILRGSGDSKMTLSPSEAAMVVGAVQILASLVETMLADRAGRRPLLMLSCILSSVSLIALGVHAYLDVNQHEKALSISWLPTASVVLFIITYILGLGPLPWAVLGEVFPSSCKSGASILSGCFCGLLAFVTSVTFLPLSLAIACLSLLGAGAAMGWTSPVIDHLQGKVGSYRPLYRPLTTEEASWVSSLMTLGAMLGPLCGGICVDRIGRKYTLLLMGGVPAVIGWILVLLARNAQMLYAARFLTGIATGSASTIGPAYIAEVSSPSVRGTLASLPQLMMALGLWLQYLVGPYSSYYGLGGMNLAISILFLSSFSFMPESPYFLIAAGKKEQAQGSLSWLRGRSRGNNAVNTNVEDGKELERITAAVTESGISGYSLRDCFRELFSSPGNRRAFMIMSVVMLTQQFCGINAVTFNAETIFRGSNDKDPFLGPSESAIVLGAVQFSFSFLETFLADKTGRRPLLLFSTMLAAISLSVLGVHSYLNVHQHQTAVKVDWLPMVCLILFEISFSIGIGPLSWAVLGELFPSSSKSAAGILCGSIAWFSGFVVTRTYQPIVQAADAYTAYWFYAVCSLGGFTFIFIFLPETKRKTLEHIQKDLEGHKQNV